MEGFIVILGLCITFTPVVLFANYMISKASRITRFDAHLELVKDKKGNFGVAIAYAERFLLGLTITSMGVVLSEFFENQIAIEILIISVVLYIIVKFFDEKNEN